MVSYIGDFAEDATVYHYFNTFSSNDPSASVTATTLADTDIYVYKDGSITDLVTDGATVVIDFDGRTGIHKLTIDTSVHADYATGSDYLVIIEGATVDGGNITAAIFTFSIENRFAEVDVTKIGGDAQSATDLKDFADAGYDPATNKVQGVVLTDTLTTYTGNTVQTGDTYALANGATGFAAIDTVVDAVKVKTDFLPSATAGSTGGVFIAGTNAATTVTTSFTSTFTGNLTGSVGSVTGAVGSVTGAVGSVTGAVGSVAGNVDGTVASVTGAVGSVTGAVGSVTGAVGSVAGNVDGTVASVVTKTGYSLVSTGADLVLKSSTFALAMADAIWDEAIAGHLGAGSTGLALNSAGAAGDPWSTALPGAYGAGTAGKIVGDNVDAAISGIVTTLGTAGAGLTDLGGMSTGMKAEVQTEADASLVSIHLDHLVSVQDAVADLSATASSFETGLTEASNAWDEAELTFISGNLSGQTRVITDYSVTNGTVTVNEAFTESPANTDAFIIRASHTHSTTQIADFVWDELLAGHVDADSAGLLLNDWQDGGRLDLLLDAIPTTAMRGTDNAATAASLATAQTDLDTLTGTDGVTLATSQGNYAPATAASLATAQTDLDTITGSDGVTLATAQALYAPAKVADVTGLLTTQMTEAYNADGTAPTVAQAFFVIMQTLTEHSYSGTTMTVKKLDGSTTAFTGTLDDGTNPTSVTRAT